MRQFVSLKSYNKKWILIVKNFIRNSTKYLKGKKGFMRSKKRYYLYFCDIEEKFSMRALSKCVKGSSRGIALHLIEMEKYNITDERLQRQTFEDMQAYILKNTKSVIPSENVMKKMNKEVLEKLENSISFPNFDNVEDPTYVGIFRNLCG